MTIAPGHFRTPLLPTALHARTAPLNRLARRGNRSGFQAALCFGDVGMEYTAIRSATTLYDLWPMTKYGIASPGAQTFPDRLTPRQVARLAPGALQYTLWCDDADHVRDDGTLFPPGSQDVPLLCQDRHLPWLIDSADSFDTTVTGDIASLSLQCPCAAAMLAAAGVDGATLPPFHMADFPVDGVWLAFAPVPAILLRD